MPDKKISQLLAVSAALLTDILPVVQGGVTSRETVAQIWTLLQAQAAVWAVPAQAGTAEVLATWRVADDATSKIAILNDSATDGSFRPALVGTSSSTGVPLAIYGRGTVDGGSLPLLQFYAETAAGGVITVRPLASLKNHGTEVWSTGANGDWTYTVIAQAGTAEVLATWSVSDDGVAKLQVLNGTGTDGQYNPRLQGTGAAARGALDLVGVGTTDTGTTAVITIQGRIGANSDVNTRPVLNIANRATVLASVGAKGDWTYSVQAQTGVAETLFTWAISDDATGLFQLSNGTASAGLFAPVVTSIGPTSQRALLVLAQGTTDSGALEIMGFRARIGAGSNPTVRSLFAFQRNTVNVATVGPFGDWTYAIASQSGVAEALASWSVTDDATGLIAFENRSATDALLLPQLRMVGQGTQTAMFLTAQGTTDGATTTLMNFISRLGVNTAPTTRNLFAFLRNTSNITVVDAFGRWAMTPTASTTGETAEFTLTLPNRTGIGSGNECNAVRFDGGSTRTWSGSGTTPLQRDFYIAPIVYAGSVASQTFTIAVSFAVEAPPGAGANAIIGRGYIATFGVPISTASSDASLVGTFASGTNAAGFVVRNASAEGILRATSTTVQVGAQTSSAFQLITNGSSRGQINTSGGWQWTPAINSANVAAFLYTPANDTALTNATERPLFEIASATRNWSGTGTTTLQRDALIRVQTYTGSVAQTFSDAATFAIEGPPVAAAGATITKAWSQVWGTPEATISSAAVNALGVFGDGQTQVVIRDNTNNVEAIVKAQSAGVVFGSASANSIILIGANVTKATMLSSGRWAFTPSASAVSTADWALTPAPQSATPVNSECNIFRIDIATRTWAGAGTVATQRDYVFSAQTLAGSAATTFTEASTVAITGAPNQGANATIGTAWALNVQAGKTKLAGGANIGTSGTTITQVREFLQVLTPSSVGAFGASGTTQTFTVTGLDPADVITVNPGAAATPGTGIGGVRCSATDTLEVEFYNTTGLAATPSSSAYSIVATRF